MLYAPERHVPLQSIPWVRDEALREIAAIVKDTEAALTTHAWWPLHPRDEDERPSPPPKTLYMGATGVMWAMEFLAQKGVAKLSRSYESLWLKACDDYFSVPDTGDVVPSWFLGSSFPLLLCMLRGPKSARPAAAEMLYASVSENIENPTWEILWGSPGTMLAALYAYEATKEQRWLDLYKRNAERLIQEWRFDETLDCDMWVQDLYGNKGELYGAGHGFSGNAFALLRGKPSPRVVQQIIATTKKIAVRESGRANWPATRRRPNPTLTQWCHGAPGILMNLVPHIPVGRDAELDALFLEAGELVWDAGPLRKGASFCHGTDGNGMALLTLFKRTGEQRWLDRARAFAMHAVAQSRQNLAAVGFRRYSLWTGDLGLAVYLHACLEGKPHMPALDFV